MYSTCIHFNICIVCCKQSATVTVVVLVLVYTGYGTTSERVCAHAVRGSWRIDYYGAVNHSVVLLDLLCVFPPISPPCTPVLIWRVLKSHLSISLTSTMPVILRPLSGRSLTLPHLALFTCHCISITTATHSIQTSSTALHCTVRSQAHQNNLYRLECRGQPYGYDCPA